MEKRNAIILDEDEYKALIDRMDATINKIDLLFKENERLNNLTGNSKVTFENSTEERLLTSTQAQEFLNIPERSFYRLIEEGKILKYKIGHSPRFKLSELRKYVKNIVDFVE